MEGGTGLTGMLDGIKTEVLSAVTDALPIVGGVVGVIVGINYGWKFFKRLTGART